MIEFVDQGQVDALIQGTQAPKPEASTWAFAAQPRLPRERRMPLDDALRVFARDASAYLTSRMQAPIEVRLAAVETAKVAEWLLSLEAPCAAQTWPLAAGDPAIGVFDFGLPGAYQLVDRLLGGPGEAAPPRRALSSLEQSVLRLAAQPLLERLRAAWSPLLPYDASAARFEADPAALAGCFVGAEVVAAHFEVVDGASRSLWSLGLPAERVAAILDPPHAAAAGRRREAGTPLARGLRAASVNVAVRLPAFRLSARSLSRLGEGHVIYTAQPVDAPLEVHVNGTPRYHAQLGRVGGHVGGRIAGPIEDHAPRPREGRVL